MDVLDHLHVSVYWKTGDCVCRLVLQSVCAVTPLVATSIWRAWRGSLEEARPLSSLFAGCLCNDEALFNDAHMSD